MRENVRLVERIRTGLIELSFLLMRKMLKNQKNRTVELETPLDQHWRMQSDN